ncbi:MAG TPA: transcriptional regulator [Pyrinomonadaceae bacterium]|nr:transcriptional regulator [Pyrinomonadaceae bacterium]
MAKTNALKTNQRKTATPQQSELREVGRAASADASPPPERSAAELDRLIHERLRLGIVSALAGNDSLTFNELKQILKTTDGNLSVHARKLEDANYVTCEKSFEGRTPKTAFRLTDEGRRALTRYLDHMESIIRTARER